ncbi:uncharacterized protein LOC117471941 isoform X2 [Trematomus bernacchii]|uniref:uncharacterized protein LOC117471941 isoform X2 n=1 Tax=Trematomus bernacchii TaxID=40690 RepID=UPI00146A6E31|nr:uncharacterized protein LOC117471941 isoform X2 [Trematomus bernacchii]
MAEIRWIQMMFLLLQITGVATKQRFIVKEGVEVTLPCNNAMGNCEGTTWLFNHLKEPTALLAEGGLIHKDAKAKADRLSVTDTCSLGIKKVTEEDASQYTCRQFRSGEQQTYQDSPVYLSVVNMTEHQDNDEVTLLCSVKTYERCELTVKWLLQGQDVDKDHRDMTTSQSLCSASVTFPTSLFSYTTRSELFTCEVTDKNTRDVQVFLFSPQSSVPDWLRLIIVSVGLASLIIIVVTVTIWTRAKGNKAQTDDNAVHNDEDEGVVTYENVGEPSASIRLH